MQVSSITGRLGADPKLSYSDSGTPTARFSVAVERRRKVGSEWQSETVWHDVTVFGSLAENVTESLAKGTDIIAIGRIESPRVYEKKDGTTAASLPFIADEIGVNLRWQLAGVTKLEKQTTEAF